MDLCQYITGGCLSMLHQCHFQFTSSSLPGSLPVPLPVPLPVHFQCHFQFTPSATSGATSRSLPVWGVPIQSQLRWGWGLPIQSQVGGTCLLPCPVLGLMGGLSSAKSSTRSVGGGGYLSSARPSGGVPVLCQVQCQVWWGGGCPVPDLETPLLTDKLKTLPSLTLRVWAVMTKGLNITQTDFLSNTFWLYTIYQN